MKKITRLFFLFVRVVGRSWTDEYGNIKKKLFCVKFDKIRKNREYRKFKIGILESSIHSLSASGQTVTDLMMEVDKLKSTFP